tara:strand:+ start:13068 stop:13325 length:258 start_codon:yes stop_codon:yes gene_type:complete
MPTNKHKRKASAHTTPRSAKNAKSPGLITLHPKIFMSVGLLFVALGLYIMAFEAQSNAMFGIAMLSLVAGTATTIYANFTLPKAK